MNNLFLYRLALIAGQIALLVVNLIWPILTQASGYLWVACLVYLFLILVVQLWATKIPQITHQSPLMLLLDLFMWGVYFSGLDGVSNPLIWCLLIPSVLCVLSQGVMFTWLVTGLANVIYGVLWWLTPVTTEPVYHGDSMQQHITGMWLGFIAVSVLLTWVTTTLMQRLNLKNVAIMRFEKQQQADENIIKMATLATSLAHELGTPLASIKLLVDELKFDLDSPQQAQDLDLLDSQVMRCKKVLSELTALTDKSRMEDAKVQPVVIFMNEIVQASGGINGVVKIVENHTGSTLIMVDALLHLAVMNVLNNAIAAGAEKITIKLTEHPPNIHIDISDDGQGRAHKNVDGMGIGLELTSRIIKSIGGDMSFNRSNSGAQCLMAIPVVEGKAHE